MSKKILLLANNCTGLLSFRKEVLEAFVKNGYEVTVSIPADSRIPEVEAIGCRVIPVKNLSRRGTNFIKDIALLREYLTLIKSVKPDVILTYTIKPNVYGGLAASLADIPYIVNITGLGTALEYPGILQKITTALYRIGMRKANCIFFQNEGNREFFESFNIRNEVHRLIPGSGVNLSKFEVGNYPEDETVRFIFISRLMKPKGIEEYFTAAKHFRNLRKDVEFHILGSAEDDYTLELEQLQNDGTVIYHGQQKDVRPYIRQSHCLIHPTYYPEGMSNVILEASASGRPVITTRRHGCMEAVDDGSTGFLFNERDTSGLISCIERFLSLSNTEKAQMGINARRKMEKEFDRNIVIASYIDAINNALRTKR